MESLRAYNMKLVANILPLHVAEHFLKSQNNKDEVGDIHQDILIGHHYLWKEGGSGFSG